MKKTGLFIAILFASFSSYAQNVDKLIDSNEVKRIINTLAADDMEGRATYTPGIDKAAKFIQTEFRKIGLDTLAGTVDYRQQVTMVRNAPPKQPLFNVVGIIPGKSKPEEYVVFSAHYDHLGIRKSADADSIYNGADDDASGTTAVIALANYFKKVNDNARTLIFVAFTAEEIGGFGAQFFSKQVNPDNVVAMFNIEMIGKESKFGTNSAFITGYEMSNFGEILQNSLKDTKFKFYPDPYPSQRLFYRSDNATLARLGVPAHTISTVQIDTDKFYHTAKDEVNTLDVGNITSTIKAIALSSRSIVSGKETPTRVAKAN